MDLCRTAESVVVRDGQGRVPQFCSNRDEFIRMRGSIEEAEVRVSVKLCVPCHPTRLIERMFDMHGVSKSTRIGAWTTT